MPKSIFSALLLVAVVFMSSCATIFNGKTQDINISHGARIKDVKVDSALHTDYYWHTVNRSRKPLTLTVLVDGQQKRVEVKAHNSFAFWLNGCAWFVPMLIDRKKPQRFAYPRKMYVEYKDSTVKIHRFKPPTKGTIDLIASLPYVNSFNMKLPAGKFTTSGFWGASLGVDYYYTDNKFISMQAGVATNILVPFPAAIDYRGTVESATTGYINLRNNHALGRFEVGYGLSLASLNYEKKYYGDDSASFIPLNIRNKGLGLSLAGAYRFSEYFRLGLLYQPMLFSKTKAYQHFFSMELIWKIPVRRGYERY